MLQVRNISKEYVTGSLHQTALDNVSLDFRDNEFVAVLGPSGSGKTTLLNIIGGLDRYDEGDLIINGISTREYKDKDWDAYRSHTIGFVFQSYNLIPHQTVLSNVELALTISGISGVERKQRAIDALEKVGLGDQIHKKPNQLSGGQMQRVAIARALVNDPDIILADEPTGALDSKTSVQIMDILKEAAKDRLVVMVTHNPELADRYATRIIHLKDGQITSDSDPVTDTYRSGPAAKPKHTHLGFLTALALSVNNLLTKKGRTFLTSFASSVGIIGIALILALSNGMNTYIESVESSMLNNYPIQLQKQSIDLGSAMSGDSSFGALIGDAKDSSISNDSEDTKFQSTEPIEEDKAEKGTIRSSTVTAASMSNSASLLKKNDLSAFKKYLDKNSGQLNGAIDAIEYKYEIEPEVYRTDKKNGIVKVYPSTLNIGGDAETKSAGGISGMMGQNTVSSSWTQLADAPALRKQSYSVVHGKWPQKANEVALIVDSGESISDYDLYTLGFMDISQLDKMIKAANQGKAIESKSESFTYDDIIGRSFTAFAPAQLYQKSGNIFVNRSGDASFVKKQMDSGIKLKITGIIKAEDKAPSYSGIAYTSSLTKELMKTAADTPAVKAQLADKKTNILTGKKFSDDDASDEGADIGKYIGGLFSTQMSLEEGGAASAPAPAAGMMYKPGERTVSSSFTADTKAAVSVQTQANQLKFMNSVEEYVTNFLTDTITEIMKGVLSSEQVQKLVKRYMDSLTPEQKQELFQSVVGSMSEEEMAALAQSYAGSLSQEDIANMVQNYVGNMSDAEKEALVKQYVGSMSQEDIQKIAQQYIGSMSDADMQAIIEKAVSNMSQEDIQKYLQQYIAQNQDKLGGDQLQSLIQGLTGTASANSYDGVLNTLQYHT